MKKISFLLTMLVLAVMVHAQYDEIKNTLLIPGRAKDAKDMLEKKWSNAKFVSKPEAYILRASIYGTLAADSINQGTTMGDQYQAEAETAFKKYMEMEPSLELMKDPIYRNGPIAIYSNLFSAGYKDYQAKKFAEAFQKFKKVADLSDVLAKQQLLTSPVDTNTLILAAYTAENSNNKDEAAKYYAKLADAKVEGENFESVYRFLVTHSFEKKDMAGFEKYKALGAQLYPKSEFFTYDKVDFAVGLENDANSKLKALEQTIANDPSNYKANLALAQVIYDTLHSEKEGAVKPANAAELEAKMITALNKAAESKPDDVLAYLVLGDHYINRSIEIDKDRETHAADMKKRTKPGTSASKEDIAKRDALDKQYAEAFDSARVPYEKAAEIYAKKGTLSGSEKQQYKKAAGYLGDIYSYKAARAKGKPADLAKFQAEEKKWNDLYGSIK